MLSKDKSCYKGIGRNLDLQQSTNLDKMSKEQLLQLRNQIKKKHYIEKDISGKNYLGYHQK